MPRRNSYERKETPITRLMEREGISSYLQLAIRAELDPSTVNSISTGKKKAQKATLEKLAKALNEPYENLVEAGLLDSGAPERGKQGGRGKESSRPALNGATAYVEAGAVTPVFTL